MFSAGISASSGMNDDVYINAFNCRIYDIVHNTSQGRILSSLLYLVDVNDLITEMEKTNRGAFYVTDFTVC